MRLKWLAQPQRVVRILVSVARRGKALVEAVAHVVDELADRTEPARYGERADSGGPPRIA
jgi:hypothetical protein